MKIVEFASIVNLGELGHHELARNIFFHFFSGVILSSAFGVLRV